MRKDWYIVIQSWMVTDLKLSGNELVAYAVIYGFSKDGESRFCGSIKDMSDFMGVSKSTAMKSLNKLVEDCLIIKETEKAQYSGLKLCYYKVNPRCFQV